MEEETPWRRRWASSPWPMIAINKTAARISIFFFDMENPPKAFLDKRK
jgi:hypothetical protein